MRDGCWTASPSCPCRRSRERGESSTASGTCSRAIDREPPSRRPSPHSPPLMASPFAAALRDLAALAERVATEVGPDMDRALALVQSTVSAGGTLYFCGNGGSAADAQHMATEYVVRYMRNR